MIMVMKANGMALEHIGEEMKGDRELCTAAVAHGFALSFRAIFIRSLRPWLGDRELCTAAVAQNGDFLLELTK